MSLSLSFHFFFLSFLCLTFFLSLSLVFDLTYSATASAWLVPESKVVVHKKRFLDDCKERVREEIERKCMFVCCMFVCVCVYVSVCMCLCVCVCLK